MYPAALLYYGPFSDAAEHPFYAATSVPPHHNQEARMTAAPKSAPSTVR